MSLGAIIRPWLPPALLEARRRHLGHALRFTDAPADWAGALRVSTGYSADSIIERVAVATREVVEGRALFERDSVLFHEPDYPYFIVTGLLRAALAHRGRLNVIDFGGSLGSTYRQCRPLLDGVDELCWQVVEQPGFVALGRREFTTHELHFAPSVSELRAREVPPLVLLSSVLQYLEQPEATLTELLGLDATHLVIDRTPISILPAHRLCIQHAPRSIYQASYPCWVLSRQRLLALLEREGWEVLAEFDDREGRFVVGNRLEFEFRGLIAQRRRLAT